MAVTTILESGTDATQDLTFYNATTGTVASATDQQKTGPRSLKLSTGNPATAATASIYSVLADAGSQISVWVRLTDVTPSSQGAFIAIRDSADAAVWQVFLNTNGTLANIPFGATAVNGTAVLAINTWTRISISYYVTNTTTFAFKVYVNGVLDSTATAGTMTRTGTNRLRFTAGALLGISQDFWVDDVYVATGGASSSAQPDTGDIRVTAKRPNANGTTNGYTTQIGAGGSGYGSGHSPQVNEQPLSATNGWSMIGAGSAVTEEYNVENLATGDVNITGFPIVDIMGWVYTSAIAPETGQIIVNGSASNISITATNALFVKAAGVTTFPAGTGTDIGEITSTDLTTVSLFECGILVAYQPSTFPGYYGYGGFI